MTSEDRGSRDPYCYPGTATLINRFNIRDNETLSNCEFHVLRKAALLLPVAPPTEVGLKDTHLYLYGQLYSWAGQQRVTDLTTAGIDHAKPQAIGAELSRQFAHVKLANNFAGLKPNEFAEGSAPVIGTLAVIAPFRSGNDMALRYFTQRLAQQAGHNFSFKAIDPQAWATAKQQSSVGNFKPMQETIRASISAAPALGLLVNNSKTQTRPAKARDDSFTR